MGNCATDQTTCVNPCAVSQVNTTTCESLPSQIQNFTDQFFGTVTKTEVDGVISWSLPCGLDVGLPNNPRSSGEGLACYFLRLFEDGIIGLTGPRGLSGTDGAPGRNAFTVTLTSFAQPSLGSPIVSFQVFANPVILADTYIVVQDSGWYLVNSIDTAGVGSFTLVKSLGVTAVGDTVDGGKLVFPSGFPGVSVTGPQGIQGIQGIQGPAGNTFTSESYLFSGSTGDYALTATYATVNFAALAQVTLINPGTYLVSYEADLIGKPSANALTDFAYLKLVSSEGPSDVAGTEHIINGFVDTARRSVSGSAIITVLGAAIQISLTGKVTVAAHVDVSAVNTTISAVRLA
jgi:hypothetical protein